MSRRPDGHHRRGEAVYRAIRHSAARTGMAGLRAPAGKRLLLPRLAHQAREPQMRALPRKPGYVGCFAAPSGRPRERILAGAAVHGRLHRLSPRAASRKQLPGLPQMTNTRREVFKFAGGAAAGALLTPAPWRLITDAALWSENWPGIPRPARGEIRAKYTNCSLCTAGCPVRARCVADQPVSL